MSSPEANARAVFVRSEPLEPRAATCDESSAGALDAAAADGGGRIVQGGSEVRLFGTPNSAHPATCLSLQSDMRLPFDVSHEENRDVRFAADHRH